MSLDIWIVVGIGFTQVAITWYGVHVSVAEGRLRNAIIIGLIGGAGIGLTVWGAVRSGATQAALRAQLDKIQQNTEKPQLPPQVTINTPPLPQPDRHTHVSFVPPAAMGIVQQIITLPFKKGEKIGLNVGFSNGGEYPVLDSQLRGLIFLTSEIPGHGKTGNWQQVKRKIPPHIIVGQVLLPHVSPVTYFSFFHADLTEEQASDLNSGTDQLCVAGFVTWKDETGRYETDLLECGYIQVGGVFNWHAQPVTDQEHKL
jgi:hypothetical protein